MQAGGFSKRFLSFPIDLCTYQYRSNSGNESTEMKCGTDIYECFNLNITYLFGNFYAKLQYASKYVIYNHMTYSFVKCFAFIAAFPEINERVKENVARWTRFTNNLGHKARKSAL